MPSEDFVTLGSEGSVPEDTVRGQIFGTPDPTVSQPFLGGSAEAEEEERKRLKDAQDKAAGNIQADQEALGGVAGSGEALAGKGVSLGGAGQRGAEKLLQEQQSQLQQLFLRSMGVGVSPAEQAVNQAISQQQQGIQSSVGSVRGRGAIGAARQGQQASEALALRGRQQEQLAGLEDQIQSQGVFGETLNSFRDQSAILQQLGGEQAGGALGLQGQTLADILGKDVMQESQLTEEELKRLQLQLGADTNLEQMFAAKNQASSGFLGGVMDFAGGLVGGMSGGMGGGGGGGGGGGNVTGSDSQLNNLGFSGTSEGFDRVSDDQLLGASPQASNGNLF